VWLKEGSVIMEFMKKIKHNLMKELKEYAEVDISSNSLEEIHKITDTIKNIDKICMLEEKEDGYSERYYHDEGSSYGRGRNARRDPMGRYSRDGGYSENDYEDPYNDSHMSHNYSKDDAKGRMMNKLGEMMRSADSEQRRILEKCMKDLEKA
jgi:hypothetical protein